MDSAVFAMATNRFDLTPSTSIYNASQSKKEICDMCAQVLISSRAALEPSSLVALCENRWGQGLRSIRLSRSPSRHGHSEPAASFPAPATGQSGPAFVAHLLSAASAPNCHLVIKRAPPG